MRTLFLFCARPAHWHDTYEHTINLALSSSFGSLTWSSTIAFCFLGFTDVTCDADLETFRFGSSLMFFRRVLHMKWEHHSATALEKEKTVELRSFSLLLAPGGSTDDIMACLIYYVIISARVEPCDETNTFNPILKSLSIYLAMEPILWRFKNQVDSEFLGLRSKTKSRGTGLYWERRSHKAAFREHRDRGLESGVDRYDHITYHIITLSHYHISCMRGSSSTTQLQLSCTSSSWQCHPIQLDKDTEYPGWSQCHQT